MEGAGVLTLDHFVSRSCVGENCGMCHRAGVLGVPATHKVGEELPNDYPMHRHNATQYVCCKHFADIVSPLTARTWTKCEI